MTTLHHAIATIEAARRHTPRHRAALVGISGIDASGKGYLSARMEQMLRDRGHRVALINVDGWLELPERRFDPRRPGEHFFERGIRFGEMFESLVLPLQRSRSILLEARHADSTDRATWQRHVYDFRNIDVILLEGVFLFRASLREHFDLTLWIDCTFETALERAIARGQEGLPPDEVIRDYQTIYFPAQRTHFERDNPRDWADLTLPNDARLRSQAPAGDMGGRARPTSRPWMMPAAREGADAAQ